MTDTERRARRLIVFAVAVLFGGVALAWSLYIVRDALQLLYLSVMLSLGVSPVVRWIENRHWFGGKRRMPRWLAILTLYAVLAVLVVLTLDIIVPPLIAQVRDLSAHLPEYNDHAQAWLVSHRILRRPFTLAEMVERAPDTNATVSGILGVVNQAVGLVLTGFTVLVLSFYLLVEGEDLFKGLVRVMPDEVRPRWWRIGNDVAVKVGAWMGGQFVLCVMIGTSAGIGFWLIGLPYFYVLGLVCGIGEVIPMIGPIIAAVPAVLVGATLGVNTAVIVAIFMFVQQQIENNVIIPRLMQKQTGISPILVMVAILIGGSLLGVLGALLAVPTAAILQILVREYLINRDAQ